jgi:hypothetical protein
LKEEALDRIKWRNRFGRGCGPVVRQITDGDGDGDDDDDNDDNDDDVCNSLLLDPTLRQLFLFTRPIL